MVISLASRCHLQPRQFTKADSITISHTNHSMNPLLHVNYSYDDKGLDYSSQPAAH
jgi:hypothetical protein